MVQLADMERLTIGDLFDRVALGSGDPEALVFPAAQVRWGYRETHARVTQLAKGLIGLGINTGDHVALWGTNRAEWILLQLALAKIGAVFVPVDPATGADELAAVLVQCDISTLFLVDRHEDVSFVDVLLECCPELANARPGRLASRRLPVLKRVALLGATSETEPPGALSWTDVLTAGIGVTDHMVRRRQDAIEPTDVVTILYGSEDEGPTKGAELTHLNLVNDAFYAGECMRLTRRDRVCVPVPLSQSAGCVLGTLGVLGRGAVLVVPAERFEAGRTLRIVAAEHCTALYGEPRTFGTMFRHPETIRVDLRSLRTGVVVGAGCSTELMHGIVERLHVPDITVAYGRNEATAVITQTRIEDPFDVRVTTVGRALPHVEVKVVDPKTGVEMARGTEGELCCRGYAVMRGYYGLPEATAAAIGSNGWLRTGDRAVMDQHGYCTITGRFASKR
jgi:fatty-acyl-CoA synthase